MELNGTIFLQIFFFLTLLLWLSRFLFSPIMRLFDEREKRIFGSQEEALKMNLLADEKAKTFDEMYEKAREQARHSLSAFKANIEKQEREALDKAKVLARARVDEALAEIKASEDSLRVQLRSSAPAIADDVVGALLRYQAE